LFANSCKAGEELHNHYSLEALGLLGAIHSRRDADVHLQNSVVD
jgi:hypothetical protein